MELGASWSRFGRSLRAALCPSLAAFLGDEPSRRMLEAQSLPIPTQSALLEDPVFDPNPHCLDLPSDAMETAALVNCLALWGPEPLMRAALASAELELQRHTCRDEFAGSRRLAFRAAQAHVEAGGAEIGRTGRTWSKLHWAVRQCRAVYAKHTAEGPESEAAGIAFRELGAAWFAAETVAADYQLQENEGPGPREASPTWLRRNSVWPNRAAQFAAEHASHEEVRGAIRQELLRWATAGGPPPSH